MQESQRKQSSSAEYSCSEQAAAWFIRIQQHDCSEADKKAFAAWLAENESHRNEYRQYAQLWRSLDQLECKPERTSLKKPRSTVTWVILLAAFLGSILWLTSYEETIITAVGERRQIVLRDGTTVAMNTNTMLHVRPFWISRQITLEQGEALFNVGQDHFRSFEVLAGNGSLRDIGTEFNVAKEMDRTTVAVLEGAIEVRLNDDTNVIKTLYGGQQLTYSTHNISEISSVEVDAVTAWHKSRLIFRNTPLNEVIEQINRYHSRPIKLTDHQLGQLEVSGEFNATDRKGLLQALETLLPLRSFEDETVTLIFPEK